MIRPAARAALADGAAWLGGLAGRRRAAAKSVDTYPPDCAGFGPRSCAGPPGPAPAGLVWLLVRIAGRWPL